MTIGGIILVGEPGSGKSSISEALLLAYPTWARRSFAGALKNELAEMLGSRFGPRGIQVARKLRKEMDAVETKDAYRPMLQALGAFRRGYDQDHWLNILLRTMRTRGTRPEGYVIDDCRYNNEADALSDRGLVIVRLEDGETTRPLTKEQRAHASERDWRTWVPALTVPYVKGPEKQAAFIYNHFNPTAPTTVEDVDEVEVREAAGESEAERRRGGA